MITDREDILNDGTEQMLHNRWACRPALSFEAQYMQFTDKGFGVIRGSFCTENFSSAFFINFLFVIRRM